MANVQHLLATPKTARVPAMFAASLITLLAVAAVVAIGSVWVSVRTRSAADERAIALARNAVRVGMSRADCYRQLRALHLVATNLAYASWSKNALGVWYRSSQGAWPQPADVRTAATAHAREAAHPDIEVKLYSGLIGGCGTAIAEQMTFDRFERIASIDTSIPFWTCR